MVPVTFSRPFCLVLGLLCAVVTPLEAGVIMSLRTTDYSRPDPTVEATRMVIDSELLKMDIASQPTGDGQGSPRGPQRNHSVVFRGGEEASITVIDHEEKNFSVLDREAMASFTTEMQILMEATERRIATLPPEQQEIVRRMLESQHGKTRKAEPPPATVLETSHRDVVNDLPCIRYDVFRGGEKLREVWVARPDAVPGGDSALTLLREMSDFYSRLMESFDASLSSLGGGFGWDQHPFEDLQRMQGFPVLTRNFVDGRVRTEVALQSIEERPISAAEFEPPQNYSVK